jgi:hypothetical protein
MPNTLTFDPVKHEYFWNGIKKPCVSDIIAPLRDFSAIPPQVLETKRQWGEAVHLYTAMNDQGTLDPDRRKWDQRMIPIVDAWNRFIDQFDLDKKLVAIETKLYSEKYQYAGTADRFYDDDTIVDIKTAAASQKSTGVQLAAYANLAFEDGDFVDIYGKREADGTKTKPVSPKLIEVRLLDDGTFKTKQYDFAPNWNIFMCLLTVYNFRENR